MIRSTGAYQGQDKSFLCDLQYWGLPRSDQEFITWSAVLGPAKVRTRVYYMICVAMTIIAVYCENPKVGKI